MWEMIEKMASDRLWIYTGIAGSVFGAAFLMWFKDTRMAIWAYSKFDVVLDYFVKKWGWTWLQEPKDMWRKRYPRITKKIDELEKRIKELEGTSNGNKNS
jgi:hypothetical protein